MKIKFTFVKLNIYQALDASKITFLGWMKKIENAHIS